MLTREILELITHKLRSVIIYLVAIGLLFFALAVAVLFYPELLQYIFVLAFFSISFLAFLISIKINGIKRSFDNLLRIFSKKIFKKKK